MKRSKQHYSAKHTVFSIFAVLVLAWLTVCLPYVNEQQQKMQAQMEKESKDKTAANNNPLNNTTEEKSESATSLLAEYLHEVPAPEHHFTVVSIFYKCHTSALYLAYHPELIIPPPKA